jgi:TolB-like protein
MVRSRTTPAYMSPEQAECKDADQRSDIFSFGAVLYEILSGRKAFPGTSAASVLGAILHRPPDPLDAPPELAAIVSRCLAKDPHDRYQTANDLLAALHEADLKEKATGQGWQKRWGLGLSIASGLLLAGTLGVGLWRNAHAAHSMNSIAVLPLDMESKDADADYISDGIAGSLNNSLTKLAVLKVVPNSVTQQYKGKAANFQQIGKTLGVDAVVSGNVVQHGDDLLIHIELDDVQSGKQIWGQQYARKVTDLLEVQNDLAREVSQKMRLQLSEADRQKLTLGSTTNPDAYQLYLKGDYYTGKFTRDGFNKGIHRHTVHSSHSLDLNRRDKPGLRGRIRISVPPEKSKYPAASARVWVFLQPCSPRSGFAMKFAEIFPDSAQGGRFRMLAKRVSQARFGLAFGENRPR